MTLQELYEYYGGTWTKVARELNFSFNTVYLWRKKNAIPHIAQELIEYRTDGIFKADKKL